MKAYCLIRHAPWYRREIFVNGLRAAGHEVFLAPPIKFTTDTLLLIWNRYADNHHLAQRVEDTGGVVIVAENGYIGAGGTAPKFDVHPHGPQPQHYYALSRGYHNDDACVRMSAADRFVNLGVELKPLREGGEYILICPNRAFGVPERMMHPDWAERAAANIKRVTNVPVKIRAHPGNDAPRRGLAEDLKGAKAVVIWSSSCGVHALCEGIPVVCEAPYWICKSATSGDVFTPANDALRLPALRRMAYAQWTCDEINRGVPFGHLLS